MKRFLRIVFSALAAGLLAFGLTAWLARPSASAPAGELAWLRAEFSLTPEQAAAVEKLHAAYEPVCEDHCARVQQARADLDAAATPEARAAATAELARLEQLCKDTTRAHLREVAACMDPAQARRFLALTEPRLDATAHAGPVGLR
ncbi:hypothetical protein OPIT5_00875 [Opitutaceae bacterium TAV5]|nr:hypothetical protein OPIT5_00875 [Opitutaceae bacterium TAV5]